MPQASQRVGDTSTVRNQDLISWQPESALICLDPCFHPRRHLSLHVIHRQHYLQPLQVVSAVLKNCQVSRKLELLAGSKIVMEGCVQDFEQGQQFILCVCMHHSSLSSRVSLGCQAWCPTWMGSEPPAHGLGSSEEILLGTAAERSRPALQELLSSSCFQLHLNTINTIILTLPSFFLNQLTKPESGTTTFMLVVILLLQ